MDDMAEIWEYIFYKCLEIAPQEYPVLLTEKDASSLFRREKIVQIMAEDFAKSFQK